MLRDSPAERLKKEFEAWELASGLKLHADPEDLFCDIRIPRASEPEAPPEVAFDLEPFTTKGSHILNTIPKFLSASASVFSPAMDQFEGSKDDPYLSMPMAAPYLINTALGAAHAFDQGNSKVVKWIDERRSDVLTHVDRDSHFFPKSRPEPLQELVSTDSIPIQVADIAAGIARELWLRNSLVHLVRCFEYVTYNGQRLSENEAASHQRLIVPG